MSRHTASIEWQRASADDFTAGNYSRAHVWRFDGGAVVPASASPGVVPPPASEPANVDPEEAFVAALASCHMLFFLHLASQRGFIIGSYVDEAEGRMTKIADGRIAITRVVLNPKVRYEGAAPDREVEQALHHEAHERCFIANSVKTAVEVKL